MIEQIIDEMQASLTKLRGRLRDTGTAGECTGHVASCPIHGKHGKDAYRQWIQGCPPPDLPLHTRVAKALGEHVYWNEHFKDWFISPHKDTLGVSADSDYYNYPTDLVAAIAALEEYCRHGNSIFCRIDYGGARWFVDIAKGWENLQAGGKGELWLSSNSSLPQAIREAIVAHREGK